MRCHAKRDLPVRPFIGHKAHEAYDEIRESTCSAKLLKFYNFACGLHSGGARGRRPRRRRSRDLLVYQHVERDTLLLGLDRQRPVHLRGRTHHELAAVGTIRDRNRRLLAGLRHVLEHFTDDADDTLECLGLRFRQPGQRREFSDGPDELALILAVSFACFDLS